MMTFIQTTKGNTVTHHSQNLILIQQDKLPPSTPIIKQTLKSMKANFGSFSAPTSLVGLLLNFLVVHKFH